MVSANKIIVAVGLKDPNTGAPMMDSLRAVGLTQKVDFNEQKPTSQIGEIGSDFRYLMRMTGQGNVGLGRLLIKNRSLLKALYSAEYGLDESGDLVSSINDISQSLLGVGEEVNILRGDLIGMYLGEEMIGMVQGYGFSSNKIVRPFGELGTSSKKITSSKGDSYLTLGRFVNESGNGLAAFYPEIAAQKGTPMLVGLSSDPVFDNVIPEISLRFFDRDAVTGLHSAGPYEIITLKNCYIDTSSMTVGQGNDNILDNISLRWHTLVNNNDLTTDQLTANIYVDVNNSKFNKPIQLFLIYDFEDDSRNEAIWMEDVIIANAGHSINIGQDVVAENVSATWRKVQPIKL